MESPSRSSGIEKKSALLSVTIDRVKFYKPGIYRIRLRALKRRKGDPQQSSSDPINPGDLVETTDTVQVQDVTKNAKLQVVQFEFPFKKGYCKDDGVEEVYLRIESLKQVKNGSTTVDGASEFTVYPKPETNMSALKNNGVLYQLTGRAQELSRQTKEKLEHSSALIVFSALLKIVPNAGNDDLSLEQKSPERKSPERKSPERMESQQSLELTPRSDDPADDDDDAFEDEDARERASVDQPRSPDHRTGSTSIQSHLISIPDTEEIHVQLHCVTNLPALPTGKAPSVFCVVKTKSEDDRRVPARMSTVVNDQPAFNSSWEIYDVISVEQRLVEEEVLLFKLIESNSKLVLVQYRLPINCLIPFHPYHLEMVMPSTRSPSGVRLYVSVIRKQSQLPRELPSQKFIGLEVVLGGSQQPFMQSIGPITAVAKISSNVSYPYSKSGYSFLVSKIGITPTTILFPNPSPSSFVPTLTHISQVSSPSKPSAQPRWNHSFLFMDRKENANLFTPGSEVMIEFYKTRSAMTDLSWSLENPIGYSVLPLNQALYDCLTLPASPDEDPPTALKILSVPLVGSLLETRDGSRPSVGITVRLIKTERPEPLFHPETDDNLPEINWQLIASADKKRNALPSEDALENLLLRGGSRGMKEPPAKRPFGNNFTTESDMEMKRYRQAIRRLGDDVIGLQEKIRDLEMTNDQLRRRLTGYPGGPTGISMLAASTVNGTLNGTGTWDGIESIPNRVELRERYDTMKSRLSKQADEIKVYRDKVLKLQNQLIQKNEQEKDFLKNNQTRRQENKLEKQLQSKISKVRGLEEAYRKQEKVIEKMEKLLQQQVNNSDKHDQRNLNALLEENRQLKSELQSLKEQQRLASRLQEDAHERLSVHQAQEKADGRIRSLEKQLSENARTWAHEKADLILRLREAELGLRRPSVLDNYALQPNLASSSEFNGYERSNRTIRPKQRLPSINSNY